jgi:hypothetical protein
MLENLKLNLKECENTDLSNLDIDWNKFNLSCVRYFNKWRHVTTNLNLKTFCPTQPIENQIKNFYTGNTFYEDSNDIFYKIKQIYYHNLTDDEFMPPEQSYNWYNSDIVDEFSTISNVISHIENKVNLKFGHIKLRYVDPLHVETIHTDYCNFRYHLPIVTNDNVFFVSNDQVFHMRNYKKLYKLNTTTPHTIVNAAGAQGRLHLIAVDKTDNFTFTNKKITDTNQKYIEYFNETFKKISTADSELNKELYKEIKVKLLSIKKIE